jgi:crossover junction endodeoxyribonuclease RuvC
VTRIIGIDPGLSGAIARPMPDGSVDLWDMPTIDIRGKRRVDAHSLCALIVNAGPVDMVVLEQVQGVQGSGATSAFTFGEGFGLIQGILVALERPVTLVRPQRWTADLGVSRDKGEHRRTAMGLFPASAQMFARVKDDGRADAALLAHWGTKA